MVITLTDYQLAILQYHADANNETLEDAAAAYLGAYITGDGKPTSLEALYLKAQTDQFHAALKDPELRPTVLSTLKPALTVTPVAVPPTPATVTGV